MPPGQQQRIKGEDSHLEVVVNDVPQVSLNDIRNFEITLQLDIQREGYIGEPSDRRDEVYRGVTGRMEIHFEDKGVFDFMSAVVRRATRRSTADTNSQINVRSTLKFPNGQSKLILIRDCFFGNFPINFPGRTEYGTISVDFESGDTELFN